MTSTSDPWGTLPPGRRILVITHTVTATTRLLDVLPVLEADHRIQTVFTAIPASAFDAGLVDFLRDIEAGVISWAQAIDSRFDLAISAGNSGELHKIQAPLIIMPHGIGYNKYFDKRQETRDKRQETGVRALPRAAASR